MGIRHELADGVVLAEEAGSAFLLHVPTGRYYGLNATGLVVWRALDGGADPAAALSAEYPGVDPDLLRRDAEALIERLTGAGLVLAIPA
jgi:hypothetical protein